MKTVKAIPQKGFCEITQEQEARMKEVRAFIATGEQFALVERFSQLVENDRCNYRTAVERVFAVDGWCGFTLKVHIRGNEVYLERENRCSKQ